MPSRTNTENSSSYERRKSGRTSPVANNRRGSQRSQRYSTKADKPTKPTTPPASSLPKQATPARAPAAAPTPAPPTTPPKPAPAAPGKTTVVEGRPSTFRNVAETAAGVAVGSTIANGILGMFSGMFRRERVDPCLEELKKFEQCTMEHADISECEYYRKLLADCRARNGE